MADHIVALDIGTTNVKAALFAPDMRLLGAGAAKQETLSPQVGWREHDPSSTWRITCEAVRSALAATDGAAGKVGVVSVAGPRGTFALLRDDGNSLTNFLTWQDRRAASLAANLAGGHDETAYCHVTGIPFDPSAALAKLLWLRTVGGVALTEAWQLATPQGFVVHRLGAPRPATDHSVAAHVGLLDLARLDWSEALIQEFSIPPKVLPPVVAPGTIVGQLSRSAAAELGLREGIDIVVAGSDGVCAELGAGITSEGDVYVYLGTASAVAGPINHLRWKPACELILMPGSVPGRWRVLALAMAGASALDWFAATVGVNLTDRLEELVGLSPPGSRGVCFIPTLAGSGAPWWSAQARGAFLGLSLSTNLSDMTRSVLEGVALEIRWMLDALREFGLSADKIRLTGGGARSRVWSQTCADVFQLTVERVRDPDPGLRGAALFGIAAHRSHGSALAAARELPCEVDAFSPDPRLAGRFAEAADLYREVREIFRGRRIDHRLFMAGTDPET